MTSPGNKPLILPFVYQSNIGSTSALLLYYFRSRGCSIEEQWGRAACGCHSNVPSATGCCFSRCLWNSPRVSASNGTSYGEPCVVSAAVPCLSSAAKHVFPFFPVQGGGRGGRGRGEALQLQNKQLGSNIKRHMKFCDFHMNWQSETLGFISHVYLGTDA